MGKLKKLFFLFQVLPGSGCQAVEELLPCFCWVMRWRDDDAYKYLMSRFLSFQLQFFHFHRRKQLKRAERNSPLNGFQLKNLSSSVSVVASTLKVKIQNFQEIKFWEKKNFNSENSRKNSNKIANSFGKDVPNISFPEWLDKHPAHAFGEAFKCPSQQCTASFTFQLGWSRSRALTTFSAALQCNGAYTQIRIRTFCSRFITTEAQIYKLPSGIS